MKAYLLGLTMIYVLAAGVVLYFDEAVRINNPWVLAFILSVVVVPIAASWASAELTGIIFRRGMLDPGRSHAAWRFARGLFAGLLGIITVLALVALAQIKWEDWYTMAAAAAPWSALFALIGRRARSAHLCGACGYDLRGLTSAANGRCPECGQHAAATPTSLRVAA
jgi:hypothetical protein